MIFNTSAIVTKTADYKESDKVVRLFTVDGGMIQAVLKGVKKRDAKLKFAAQPFAFCEFSLCERNGFYTVTGAVPVESFYALTAEPGRFFCASLMLETADRAVSDIPSPAVFVYLLKIFKALLYQNADPAAAAALFLLRLIENAGFMQITNSDELQNLTPESLPDGSGGIHKYMPLLKKLILSFEKQFEVALKAAKLFE